MNSFNLEMREDTNCGGKCVIEMQKNLDFDVISEFFEVVRDFHNDYKTSNELKDIIISESNECIELLKQKTAEMCSIIDEVFLNRRNQQSSFYRLCHKLARTGTSEENNLSKESKCVCFSEENLKKFNVDVSADAGIKYISNIMSTMSAIKSLHGELECTKCHRLFQTSRFKSGFVCDCHAPSISALNKLHEAILDLCDENNTKNFDDLWYFTCLRRDAEYYRNKSLHSLMSSDESVESFEVISSGNLKSENGMKMNQSTEELNQRAIEIHPLKSGMNKLTTDSGTSDICDYVTFPDSKVSNSDRINKTICRGIQSILPNVPSTIDQWLSKPLSPTDSCTSNKLDTAEISSSSAHVNKKYCGTLYASHNNIKNDEQCTPADIVKNSFNRYLNNVYNKEFTSDFTKKNPKVEIYPSNDRLLNTDKVLDAFHDFVKDNCHDKSISKMSPSDALKLSLNSHMVNKLEIANKWLKTK